MSLTCTKEFQIEVVSGCLMDTCEDKADVLLTGSENMQTIAYSPDLCYVLVITHDAGYTQTYFNKYDPVTNTLSRKATVAAYKYGNLVYHETEEVFVYVGQDHVYVFDAGLETVIDDFAIALTSSAAVYVPANDMIYCYMGVDGGGQHYIGKVDIIARAGLQLGVIPTSVTGSKPFSADLSYCPLDNSLYGVFQGTSNGVIQFNLTTNTGSLDYEDVGVTACWDSDRSLLLIFGGATAWDYNTATKNIDRTTVSAENIQMVATSLYVTSLKKAFVVGYDLDTMAGDGVVIAYDTVLDSVLKVKNDTGYTEIYPVEAGSLMAFIYNLVSSVQGVKKICVT